MRCTNSLQKHKSSMITIQPLQDLKLLNHLSFLFQWRNKLMKKKRQIRKKMISKTNKLIEKEFFLKDFSKENDFQEKLPLSYRKMVENFYSIFILLILLAICCKNMMTPLLSMSWI